jgi:cytochrome c peroxidase
MKTSRAAAGVAATVLVVGAAAVGSQSASSKAQQDLGAALFRETALTNPGSDFRASCDTCHHVGSDPRGGGGGNRFYSDGSPRSLMPGHGSVVQETTLRNTPSLLDLDRAPRLGLDGRYASLDDLLRDKLVSQHLGWKEADRARAVANLQNVLMNDARTDYRALFQAAYRVEVEGLDEEQARDQVVRALGDYVRNVRSERTSRWDAFADINRIPPAPSAGELPKHYGGRTHGRIGNQEGRLEIKRPLGFGTAAYEGFKTFFRVDGTASVGNCVVCHVPPTFTNNRFHNAGISQLEYEALHGKGSFAKLGIPGLEAKRPVASFLAIPAKDDPKRVDLGYWNWVDLKAAPERVGEESDAELLKRLAGAFRTPNLRNLPRTGPYMHNGAYASLEDAVRAKIEVSKRAQAKDLPGVDPEFQAMRLSEDDVKPLADFLRSLDEVDEREFRTLLLHFEQE